MSRASVTALVLLSIALLAACNDDRVVVDDYRTSEVLIRGTVLDPGGEPDPAATVSLTPVRPLHLRGDTVNTDAAGDFLARLGSFGVGTFLADVHLHAVGTDGASRDTTLVGIRVVEDRPRGRPPDTIDVQVRLEGM